MTFRPTASALSLILEILVYAISSCRACIPDVSMCAWHRAMTEQGGVPACLDKTCWTCKPPVICGAPHPDGGDHCGLPPHGPDVDHVVDDGFLEMLAQNLERMGLWPDTPDTGEHPKGTHEPGEPCPNREQIDTTTMTSYERDGGRRFEPGMCACEPLHHPKCPHHVAWEPVHDNGDYRA